MVQSIETSQGKPVSTSAASTDPFPAMTQAKTDGGDHGKSKWQYLVNVMVQKHRWAMQAVALRMRSAKLHGHPWKAIDTKPPTGITMAGARWGWREVSSEW